MISRWMLACVVLLATMGNQTGRAQPSGASGFFVPVPDAAGERAKDQLQGFATRSRVARVAVDHLLDERLLLNLFAGVSFDAHRHFAEAQPDGSSIWHGQVDNEPLSAVTFVRTDGLVQGSIRTSTGSYSVEPVGAGPDHVIRQMDTTVLPPELLPLVPPLIADRDSVDSPQLDDGSLVDVLVVYTAAARQQAGGSDAAVRARIALGVAETNIANANSGVRHRVRLVGTELVGYRESGDLASDLEVLTSPSDELMDIVHARRDAVGADLVKLVVGSTAGGACGVAWVMQNLSVTFAPYAFSVTAYPCISPNYTFGHELAHNMGSAHAPEDPNSPPLLPYSYGYKDPAALFRTVMAYDCPTGCPRVLHFSSPAVAYAGKPTGTPSLHNNALSLNQSAPTVANFRPSRPGASLVSVPRDFSVTTAGTTATLTWSRPATGEPTAYVIEVGSEEGLANVASIVVSGTTTSVRQPNVPPGSYFIRIRAIDTFGPGAPSTSVYLLMTGAGQCVTPVGAPVLQTPIVRGRAVTLSWTPPATGGPVHRYVIGAGTRPQLVNVAVINTGSSTTTFTAEAAPGVYFLRVAGVNACGTGASSNEVGVVVGPPVPGPPAGLVAAITVDRRVTLTWRVSPVGGAPTTYRVAAGTAPGLTDIGVLSTIDATPSFTTVAPPGRYYIRVRAVNEHGVSAPSEEIVLQVL